MNSPIMTRQPTTIRVIIHHARATAAALISLSVISVSLPVLVLLRNEDNDDITGLLAIAGEGDDDTTGLLVIVGEGDDGIT